MDRNNYKIILTENILKCADAVLLLFLLLSVREYFQQGQIPDADTFMRTEFSLWDFVKFLLAAFLWNRVFSFMRLSSLREMVKEKRTEQSVRILLSVTLGTAAALLWVQIANLAEVSTGFVLLFWAGAVILFLPCRLGVAEMTALRKKRRPDLRLAIIVGMNIRSISLSATLTRPGSGYRFLGFADNIPEEEVGEEIKRHDMKKVLSLLCSLDEFEDYVSKNPVDEVFITLPLRSYYDETARIIKVCTTQGIRTRMINDLFDFQISTPGISEEDRSASFIDYDVINRSALQHDLKRIFDILVSLAALLLLAPVFLIVALLIYFDDGLPIFFAQERIGLNKRRFRMFKFRTMVRDAEKLQAQLETLNEVRGAAFKITNDPRILKSGTFLRKSSLDEIPQFANVLLGTMSIIGPRPLPIRDFEQFYKNTHRRRFSVKPGITGLWQISGRSETDFEEWMNLDLHYIDNWNLWLDIKILLKTIPVVLMGKGAK
ncbi:MAG: sugar transferase [Desulfobacterales bacterium]